MPNMAQPDIARITARINVKLLTPVRGSKYHRFAMGSVNSETQANGFCAATIQTATTCRAGREGS